MKRLSHLPISFKRCMLSLFLAVAALAMNGQHFERYARCYMRDGDIVKAVTKMTDQQLAARNDRHTVVPASKFLLDDSREYTWTDGIFIYRSWYDAEEHLVTFNCQPEIYRPEECDPYAPFKVRKGQVWADDVKKGTRVTTELVGGRTLLVMRNALGKAFKAFYLLDYDEEYQSGWWALLLPQLFRGNYTTPAGENVIFGLRQAHYTGDKYSQDPGIFDGFRVDGSKRQVYILYGTGRVSRGDPSDPRWGKMPGGGGAAAIMGPMEWILTPSVEGLQAFVLNDERFVDHMPPIGEQGDTVMLTMAQSPYEDLPGKWAFASVIPLTHKMLELYPKEVLTLMRGEIYARHGDTFRDPATQRYFDAQPWYKKSNKPICLTDLEKFNYQLIKEVESRL